MRTVKGMKTSERTAAGLEDLRVLTEADTAELLGLHLNTLKRMRRKGTGPRVTVLSPGDKGRLGYQVGDVRRWLESRAEPQPERIAAPR